MCNHVTLVFDSSKAPTTTAAAQRANYNHNKFTSFAGGRRITRLGILNQVWGTDLCLGMLKEWPHPLAVLAVLTTVVSGDMDFHSTTLNTGKLRDTHQQVMRTIRSYAGVVQELTSTLNSYLSESAQVSDQWSNDGDPLRTYLLIRRTSVDLDVFVDAVRKLRAHDPLLEIENLRQSRALSDRQDFEGMARSLVRLQRTYRLNPLEMAQGKLSEDVHLPVHLTARDCLFLGDISVKLNEEGTVPLGAKLWYQAGLDISANDPSQEEIAHLNKRIQEIENMTATSFKPPLEFMDNLNHDIIHKPIHTNASWDYIMSTFRKLCRGEQIRSPSMDLQNSCHLRRGPHPYLKIRPLKVESLSLDPYLVIFHDIIGDEEMELMKDLAKDTMFRSQYGINASDGDPEVRISGTSWLKNQQLPNLSGRLEAMLDIDTDDENWASENYQVLNYGTGGHYTPHHDFLSAIGLDWDRHLNMYGDRIATLIMYVSSVEEGGATVFPYIGVSVKPVKGSAAFWWNLRSGGSRDYRTLHGACPVIYGNKWVTNKWFRTHQQMFRVPCGLEEFETLPQY